jgi:hypothetical protein
MGGDFWVYIDSSVGWIGLGFGGFGRGLDFKFWDWPFGAWDFRQAEMRGINRRVR